MARIQIGGAGGAPSNNVIRSLRDSGRGDHLIGASSNPTDLLLADVDEIHPMLPATHPRYRDALFDLLGRTRPDLLHVQNDLEVLAVSRLRDEITDAGVALFLPAPETVETCIDKYLTYVVWRDAGLTVPECVLLRSPADLDAFMTRHGNAWIRANVGGGGRGALPTDNRAFAELWIDRFDGWGTFMAAELLTERTVTWLSIWHEGALVVAQTRRRRSWNFGDRTLSGVTGVTGVGETASDPEVDRVAEQAIRAIDARPHGIFGVDMTYDDRGRPNPTEINIARFFTTVHFFTAAGLNLPAIYRDLALGEPVPDLERRVNPLPDGLAWVRGMDVEPVLCTVDDLEDLARRVP